MRSEAGELNRNGNGSKKEENKLCEYYRQVSKKNRELIKQWSTTRDTAEASLITNLVGLDTD